MKYTRTSNAQSIRTHRTTLTLWRKMRTGGWRREFARNEGGWSLTISYGKPRVYSKLAFMLVIARERD